jgi:hypothetical protein
VKYEFEGIVFEWRGPAPFYFVETPRDISVQIDEIKSSLSYGWGVIPVRVSIGGIETSTSIIPKNGSYFVPLKDAIRKPNEIQVGDLIKVQLSL